MRFSLPGSPGQLWHGLNPTARRVLVVGGILGTLGTLVWMFQPTEKTRTARGDRNAVIENVLMDKNTRSVSLDSMAARIEVTEEKNAKLLAEVSRLKEEVARKERAPNKAEDAAMEMQLRELQKRVGDLQQQVANTAPSDKSQTADKADAGGPGKARPPAQGGASANVLRPGVTPAVVRPPNAAPTANEFYQQASPAGAPAANEKGGAQKDAAASSTPRAPADIKVIVEEVAEETTEDAAEMTAQNYLPPGSIFSGTLLTGMDAPTGNNARKEPFPALLRIKHDAILPNRWKADVKECFLLAAGFGDLSSERALLRGETISCVTKDGKVLESMFPAYAVGEDGKAGIRGRLVSKQGQVIGRALMAGFLEGVSKAFDVKPIPVLATANTGKQQFADVFAGEESLRSAAFGGASSALDRVAQFYIDMAANIFPVIEVDSGRKIDLIATRGIQLTFRKKGKEAALRDMHLPGTGGTGGNSYGQDMRSQNGMGGGSQGGGQGSMFGLPSMMNNMLGGRR